MPGVGKDSSLKTNIVAITVVAALLVGGVGFVGYQIRSSLRKEIYGTPRGEVGESTPADYNLEYEEVEFFSENTKEDELRLKGWFVDGRSENCIILAPGKGQTRWNLLEFAPFLYEAGYDVLLFDPQGRGESEGEAWGFGYFESRDLVNAVEYLKEVRNVENVGLLGRSAGGTASLIAGLESPKVDAIVADSAFASIKLASESYGGYEDNPLFDLLFPLYGLGANQTLGTDVIQKTNLEKRIANLRRPVFFIHGKSNEVLYPKNTKLLHTNKPGEKRLWMPDGVGHVGGFEEQRQEYKERVLDFYGAKL
ncbi:MAG: alpha/beta hydrolase [Candidatus Bipolaricaulota bacterium]